MHSTGAHGGVRPLAACLQHDFLPACTTWNDGACVRLQYSGYPARTSTIGAHERRRLDARTHGALLLGRYSRQRRHRSIQALSRSDDALWMHRSWIPCADCTTVTWNMTGEAWPVTEATVRSVCRTHKLVRRQDLHAEATEHLPSRNQVETLGTKCAEEQELFPTLLTSHKQHPLPLRGTLQLA